MQNGTIAGCGTKTSVSIVTNDLILARQNSLDQLCVTSDDVTTVVVCVHAYVCVCVCVVSVFVFVHLRLN